jgi:hypothetical protein
MFLEQYKSSRAWNVLAVFERVEQCRILVGTTYGSLSKLVMTDGMDVSQMMSFCACTVLIAMDTYAAMVHASAARYVITGLAPLDSSTLNHTVFCTSIPPLVQPTLILYANSCFILYASLRNSKLLLLKTFHSFFILSLPRFLSHSRNPSVNIPKCLSSLK